MYLGIGNMTTNQFWGGRVTEEARRLELRILQISTSSFARYAPTPHPRRGRRILGPPLLPPTLPKPSVLFVVFSASVYKK